MSGTWLCGPSCALRGSRCCSATLALCLVRARDQPGLDVGIGGTTATIVPADLALAALAVVAVSELARHGVPRSAWAALVWAGAFCALVLATGSANGASAFVSGAKLVELAALGLGTLALVSTKQQLEAIVDVLLLFTIAADAVGLVRFHDRRWRAPGLVSRRARLRRPRDAAAALRAHPRR